MRMLIFGALIASAASETKHRPDQAPGTPEQVAAGKGAFAMCGACHGNDGEGKVGIAPRLNSASYLSVVSNDFLKRTIVEGRAGTNMIGFGAAMDDKAIDNLVAYVRSWQKKDGVEIDAGPLKGDLATGEKMWLSICSRCHGRSGAGYAESGSGTGIGRKAFLDQASDGMLRSVVRLGKDDTAMRPFDAASPVAVANLTVEEIDSVIMYLRKNAW